MTRLIDWSKAPEWARYAAMDCDGTWYWYENEPFLRSHTWGSCGGGEYELMAPPNSWKDSKEARP